MGTENGDFDDLCHANGLAGIDLELADEMALIIRRAQVWLYVALVAADYKHPLQPEGMGTTKQTFSLLHP